MIAADLPRLIYVLPALRLTAEAFNAFCECRITEIGANFRLELAPHSEGDDAELGRYFLNYALAASMEDRMELSRW
ncbi:MAG: hypothetical protein AABO58_04675 [Acidobacteriota bacterium]